MKQLIARIIVGLFIGFIIFGLSVTLHALYVGSTKQFYVALGFISFLGLSVWATCNLD